MAMDRELTRKAVHISMVGFALLIGRLPPAMIVVLCLVALLHNIWVLPRMTRHALERDGERRAGYSIGLLAYPASLLVLSLIFYREQVVVAVAWGIMAFGDGFAGLIGRLVPGPKLSWHPEKSLVGLLVFVVSGSVGTMALLFLLPEPMRADLSIPAWSLVVVATCLVAALVETVPGLVDDNIAVPLVAGPVCWLLLRVEVWPSLPEHSLYALVVVALLMIYTIGSRKIDLPGGIVGGLLAFAIFLGTGFGGLAVLFAFFFMGTFASKWRLAEKQGLGVAQEHAGRRSVRHALANGLVAAVCGLAGWCVPAWAGVAAAMAAGALAAASADTVASELGNLYGRRYIDITTWRPGIRGRDGVVSLEGTLFGALAAVVIAAIHLGFGAEAMVVGTVVVGGVVGNAVDSLLGGSLQRMGLMSNDTVNAVNTLAGAATVLVLIVSMG